MDPHSTHSQFNRRGPKAGPLSRPTSEKNSTQDTVKMLPKKGEKTDDTDLFIRRPIATNSRVKQDEMIRRNMYLSFVTNAFQLKSNVGS
jgi:RNA polymerase I-specific transcription initiation factor RRN3